MTMTAPPRQRAPKQYKSQPWVLFDTVASRDFTLGSATNAIGATTPAISASGTMTFFNAPGRVRSQVPWYTNLDTPGRLSFGLEIWQIYIRLMFPAWPLMPTYDPDAPVAAPTILNVPPTTRLAEALLNFGVLSMDLGQELQFQWPTNQFTGGGGIVDSSSQTSLVSNGVQTNTNVMKLPEPIECPNTQNFSATIALAAEVQGLIGTVGALGVGAPVATQAYTVASGSTRELTLQPYAVQLGLVGRRVKNTQYGQVPPVG